MRRFAGEAALTLSLLFVCACSTSSPDTRAAKRFRAFPLYWLGPRFEEWRLTAIDGLDPRESIVTFVYGTCTPHDGDEPSCTPPLQIQVSPLCRNLRAVARAPIWRRRRIRGAPVGTIDGAPVLFTSAAQVKVYRGEGSQPGDALRALAALRSINSVPPVIDADARLPSPPGRVLTGERPCKGRS